MISATEQAVGAGIEVALGGILGQKVSTPETPLVRGTRPDRRPVGSVRVAAPGHRDPHPARQRDGGGSHRPVHHRPTGPGCVHPDVAPTLGTMLGLGVGIDYALFLITKHRTLLREGYPVADSVGRTAGTAGAGMVFAGSTLIAALCGLALTGLELPGVAGLRVGDRGGRRRRELDHLRARPAGVVAPQRRPRNAKTLTAREMDEGSTAPSGPGSPASSPGIRWFAIGAALLLALLAAPAATLQLGHTDAGIYPQGTTAREATDLTTQSIRPRRHRPLAVVASLLSPPPRRGPGTGMAPTAEAAAMLRRTPAMLSRTAAATRCRRSAAPGSPLARAAVGPAVHARGGVGRCAHREHRRRRRGRAVIPEWVAPIRAPAGW